MFDGEWPALRAYHQLMASKTIPAAKIETTLRDWALAYPETTEDFPWGERAIKVKGKIFLVMSASAAEVSLSVKLPHTRDIAVDLPFTKPTHYGMGKHGWVTATVAKADARMLDMFRGWLDESYRAVAPKKLVATLESDIT